MIYFIQEKGLFRNRIKIGYTDNIRQRLSQIQSQSPSKIKLILTLPGDERDEFIYHQRFSIYRLHGEWFKFGLKLRLFIWLNQSKVFLPKTEIEESEPSYIDRMIAREIVLFEIEKSKNKRSDDFIMTGFEDNEFGGER